MREKSRDPRGKRDAPRGDDDGSASAPRLRVVSGGRDAAARRPPPAGIRPSVRGRSPDPSQEDSDATRAGPPMKVKVIAGPDAGQTMEIRGGRIIVGRSDACDLQLTDAAASRRHLEIIVGSMGVILRDLGSGNGTRVNGKRVTEAPLVHGDEVQIGQTRIAFIDEVEALRQRQAEREAVEEGGDEAFDQVDGGEDALVPRTGTAVVSHDDIPVRTRNGVFVVGGVIVLLAIGGILLLATRKPPPPPQPSINVEAGPMFEEAKRLIGAKKFKDADDKLHDVQRLAPSMPDIDDYLRKTGDAIDAEQKLAKARALIDTGSYDAARVVLKSIREPDKNLAFFDDDQLLPKMLAEIDQKQGEQLHKQIDAFLEKGQFEQAMPLIARLPASEQAGVRRQIDDAKKRLHVEEVQEHQREEREQEHHRKVRARKAQEEVDRILAPAVRKIDATEFDRAKGELDRIMAQTPNSAAKKKAKSMLRMLPELSSSYEDGVRIFEEGNAGAAARPLQKALYLYEVADLDGNLDRQIKPRLAQALYVRGKSEQGNGNYGAAAKDFRSALKVEPGNERAKAALSELKADANRIFMEAYTVVNTEPDVAKKKFHEVMDLTEPGSEAYEKAKKWLIKLNDPTVE